MKSSGTTRRPSLTSSLCPGSEPTGAEPPAERYASGVTRSLEALAGRWLQFGTVYADPPWGYRNRASRGAAENHYRTMTLDEVCGLPVGPLLAPRAHLHLWTTAARVVFGDSTRRGLFDLNIPDLDGPQTGGQSGGHP